METTILGLPLETFLVVGGFYVFAACLPLMIALVMKKTEDRDHHE